MTRQQRITAFHGRHLNYLATTAGTINPPRHPESPDLLFYVCPCCQFGYFETFELSHHGPDKHGHQAEWEPLCPVCGPNPNGPPRMRNWPRRTA